MGERLIRRGKERQLLGLLVVQQSLFLGIGIGLWLAAGGTLDSFVRPSGSEFLLGCLLTAALALVLGAIFSAFPALGDRMALEQARTIFSTERPWGIGAILVISASAGIGEEALFRGGVQTLLGDYVPAWAAILLTTILFTLAHPGSRTLMSFIAAISLTFSLAYHWTGSLLAVMVAHALFDVFGCLWTQRALRRMGHWEPGAREPLTPATPTG